MLEIREWIRRLLTKKRVVRKARRRELVIEDELPSEKLLLLAKFTILVISVLSAVEIAHLVVLGSWNSEVFSAITGAIGTFMGIVIGRKV